MDFNRYTAGSDDDGRRFDRVVRRLLSTDGLSALYKNIRKGMLLLNNKKTSPEIHVHAGDIISAAAFLCTPPAVEKTFQRDAPLPFPVIFQNEHLLFINKPYDIPVQGTGSLAELISSSVPVSASSLSFRPGPLHRLDRRTTGILAFSRSLAGAQWFTAQIASHSVRKTYLAIVQGNLSEKVRWEDTLSARDGKNTAFYTVSVILGIQENDGYGGKKAVTCAEPLLHGHYHDLPVTLTRITLETGRKHQIRAQASAHGYPLLGDTAYSGTPVSGPQQLFLHAYRLDLPENKLGIPPSLTAPLPDSFLKMMRILLMDWDESIILTGN